MSEKSRKGSWPKRVTTSLLDGSGVGGGDGGSVGNDVVGMWCRWW